MLVTLRVPAMVCHPLFRFRKIVPLFAIISLVAGEVSGQTSTPPAPIPAPTEPVPVEQIDSPVEVQSKPAMPPRKPSQSGVTTAPTEAPAPSVPAATPIPEAKPTEAESAPEEKVENPSGNFVTWEKVAELPAPPDQPHHPGLSGVFAGPVGAGKFMIAGGTYFPGKGPLDGGAKSWSDAIYVLEVRAQPGQDTPRYSWTPVIDKLPRTLAGGISLELEDGLLCIGGCDSAACRAECFVYAWDDSDKKLTRTDYPPLPVGLAWMSGAKCGSKLIIVGGSTTPALNTLSTDTYVLDLARRSEPEAFQWEKVTPLPEARLFPVCASANDGKEDCLYLISGRAPSAKPGTPDTPLVDVLKFTPSTATWEKVGDAPACLMGGSAITANNGKILVLGGDDGEIAHLLDSNARRRSSIEEQAVYQKFNQVLLENHPGYRRQMLLYDAKAMTWKPCGVFPRGTPALAPAIMWEGGIVLPCGETKPGSRSPTIWLGKPETP